MKQKIRKIVTAALLSMAILGMSVPALSASAVTGSVSGCDHSNLDSLKLVSTKVAGYTNASPSSHQVIYVTTYFCTYCANYSTSRTEIKDEPHKQASTGSLYCVCGYYLH